MYFIVNIVKEMHMCMSTLIFLYVYISLIYKSTFLSFPPNITVMTEIHSQDALFMMDVFQKKS